MVLVDQVASQDVHVSSISKRSARTLDNMQTRAATGGPHFPYLSLLVADVLQALINHDGSISHPLAPERSCPILQYADDTLLLIPAELGAVQTLESLLDQFSAATGLKINYHKSTLVPMHSSEAACSQFKAVLQCKVDSFPQVYLGLPL
ncbi:unnamed protein product [Miscanthus lutarioriparius]|uniref:Reverse transcriptase domain-containing protein n=1 Tax=Miscanthus lutarioriparius TaxID=422564 RepID=A0A811S592_9POAL|nr:unnamed protein product [Miscanthus lutarioriparius]